MASRQWITTPIFQVSIESELQISTAMFHLWLGGISIPSAVAIIQQRWYNSRQSQRRPESESHLESNNQHSGISDKNSYNLNLETFYWSLYGSVGIGPKDVQSEEKFIWTDELTKVFLRQSEKLMLAQLIHELVQLYFHLDDDLLRRVMGAKLTTNNSQAKALIENADHSLQTTYTRQLNNLRRIASFREAFEDELFKPVYAAHGQVKNEEEEKTTKRQLLSLCTVLQEAAFPTETKNTAVEVPFPPDAVSFSSVTAESKGAQDGSGRIHIECSVSLLYSWYFLLDKKLADSYARAIFLGRYRLNTNDKLLEKLTSADLHFTAGLLMSHWCQLPRVDSKTGNEASVGELLKSLEAQKGVFAVESLAIHMCGDELDMSFIDSLQKTSILNRKTSLENKEWKNAIKNKLDNLDGADQIPSAVQSKIVHYLPTLMKTLVEFAVDLSSSSTKYMRSLLEELVEHVVLPLQNLGVRTKDASSLFIKCLIPGLNKLTTCETLVIDALARFLRPLIPILLRLFDRI